MFFASIYAATQADVNDSPLLSTHAFIMIFISLTDSSSAQF